LYNCESTRKPQLMSKNVEDAEKLADEYFAFLLTDYGFAKVKGHYASYEYNFGYRKENIEIHLFSDADGSSNPFIELCDYNQLTAQGRPARYPLIAIEQTAAVKKIISRVDYDKYGKDEMEILIKENAEIIQRHPEVLRGDLSSLTKNEPGGSYGNRS